MINWPEAQVITVLDGILDAVGRDFTLNVKTTGIACPLCVAGGYLDPVTNTSTNSFCPSCYGSYYLNTTSGIVLNGHVRWKSAEIPRWYPGGIVPDGDCMITVTYSDDTRTNIERALNFEVDNKILSLKSYILKGAKTPNRIIILLKEESNNILSTQSAGNFVIGTSMVGVGKIA